MRIEGVGADFAGLGRDGNPGPLWRPMGRRGRANRGCRRRVCGAGFLMEILGPLWRSMRRRGRCESRVSAQTLRAGLRRKSWAAVEADASSGALRPANGELNYPNIRTTAVWLFWKLSAAEAGGTPGGPGGKAAPSFLAGGSEDAVGSALDFEAAFGGVAVDPAGEGGGDGARLSGQRPLKVSSM